MAFILKVNLARYLDNFFFRDLFDVSGADGKFADTRRPCPKPTRFQRPATTPGIAGEEALYGPSNKWLFVLFWLVLFTLA